jgi:hypothetical protein
MSKIDPTVLSLMYQDDDAGATTTERAPQPTGIMNMAVMSAMLRRLEQKVEEQERQIRRLEARVRHAERLASGSKSDIGDLKRDIDGKMDRY